MRTLHISVLDKKATYLSRDGDIICGNSDYVIEFAFDAEWDGYDEKTARFIWNGSYQDVTFTGTSCPVPIVTHTTDLKIGVYAGDLSTTTSATIACQRSILCESSSQGGTIIVGGGDGLPVPPAADNGKVLTAEDGKAVWKEAPGSATYYTIRVPSINSDRRYGWTETQDGAYELIIPDVEWMKEDLFIELKSDNSLLFTHCNITLHQDNGFLDFSIDSLPEKESVLYIYIPAVINGGDLNGGMI